MTNRINLFDHVIAIDRIGFARYRAKVWRSSFDPRGVINGVVVVGFVTSRSKIIAVHRARHLVRHARSRGAAWPRVHEQ